jgi:amidase
VPAAHGNDGMGSIRIPAACCGLVGIKPGSGVVPSELGADSWFGLAENGPLTTTVADSALLLSVLAARPELAGAAAPPSERLRVAVSVRAPAPATPVDSDFAAAARRTGELLARVGHQVAEQEPRYPMSMGPASLALWTAGTDRDARLVANPHLLEKRVARHAAAGRAVQRARLLPGSARESWRRVARDFFADVDVLVTPALAQPPIASARWGERGWMRNLVANTSYAPFASPWNLAGWPAMAVPAGVHPDSRTPLAVQLVAPPGNEARLLAVAAQLEALAPWPRVAPVYA